MPRVTGIGGVFVKARDPKALAAWYRDALGMDVQDWGGAQLWNDVPEGARTYGVWSAFAEKSDYFAPSERPFMINLRVDDVDGLIAQLKARGDRVLDRVEDSEFGKFRYVVDPEGTLLELFQPAP
ncbi:MAG: VOC family protein [Deltaproteobacteria bacterium]|nr:VOC family protein [Deltaproteobacteria bacterium]